MKWYECSKGKRKQEIKAWEKRWIYTRLTRSAMRDAASPSKDDADNRNISLNNKELARLNTII